jgi:hypothetical protein
MERACDWSPKSSDTYYHPSSGPRLPHIALAMRNNQDIPRTQHDVWMIVLCD